MCNELVIYHCALIVRCRSQPRYISYKNLWTYLLSMIKIRCSVISIAFLFCSPLWFSSIFIFIHEGMISPPINWFSSSWYRTWLVQQVVRHDTLSALFCINTSILFLSGHCVIWVHKTVSNNRVQTYNHDFLSFMLPFFCAAFIHYA